MNIPLRNKKGEIVANTIVDEDDYALTSYNNKLIFMHQLVYKLYNNYIPGLTDHINNNRKDNRIENLREATNGENSHNVSNSKNNTSHYHGVSWFKRDNKWKAYVTKDGNCYNLGCYKNEIDAAKAYNVKALELYGNKVNLNVIS